MASDPRTGLLNAVSNWLKLVALVVLIAEGMILAAMKLTPETNPLSRWYPLFMLLFLLVVVVGILFDRFTQTKMREQTRLTLQVEGKRLSVETSQIVKPKEELKKSEVETMFVDSRNGFMLPRPKLPGWSEPQYLNQGDLLVKKQLRKDLDTWEQEKEIASVIPLGKMFMEAETVLFEHGSPVDVEFTDETSTKATDAVLNDMVTLARKQGDDFTPDDLVELRKKLMWGALEVERLAIQNTFSITILDKNLAKGSPVVPSLPNVFMMQQRKDNSPVERLVANDASIMWGSSITASKVLISGEEGDLTMYTLNNLIEGPDRFYWITINFSPQTESEISVWEELREMFKSFRIIAHRSLDVS